MGMLEVTDNPDVGANDYVVARNMAETLQKHYPGHLWAVTCQGEQGIATVRNLALSGNWGFVIKLRELYADTHYRCVIRAGGELLERFRVRRGWADQEHIAELPTLPTGMPRGDYSHAKTRVPQWMKEAMGMPEESHVLLPQELSERDRLLFEERTSVPIE